MNARYGIRFCERVFLSAKGATLRQPGATPREYCPQNRRGLKARPSAFRRAVGPGLQPSRIGETITQGVALGWDEAGALPLRNKPTAALDAESAEVLGNIKHALNLSNRALL